MHPDELICQFLLNLKMSITKRNWSFVWNSKSLYATKSKNDATNSQIFETPTQPQMTGVLSIFVQIQSLCLLLVLRFNKMKPLKCYEKYFLLYLNCSFGSRKLPTLTFRKIQKLSDYKLLKKKTPEHIWQYLKSTDFVQKQKTNLEF